MAYKYSKGAFTASGSITAEEGLTSSTTLSVNGITTLKSQTVVQGDLQVSGTQFQVLSSSGATIFQVDSGGARAKGVSFQVQDGGGTPKVSLDAAGNVSGSGQIQAGGNATVAGTLAVNGATITGTRLNLGNDGGSISLSGSGQLQIAGIKNYNNELRSINQKIVVRDGGDANDKAFLDASGQISGSGNLNIGGTSTLNDLTVNGNLTVLGTTISASVQNLIIEDRQIVLADGAPNKTAAVGAGFFVSGANVQLTYKEQGDGAAASSGDIFQFSGSSALVSVQAKTFYGDLVGSTVYSTVGIGDADQNPLATGVSYANATFAATRTWTLPNLPTTGSSVKIKGPSNLSPIVQLIVSASAGYDIDGETAAVLESQYAAIECVFVGGPTGKQWKIF